MLQQNHAGNGHYLVAAQPTKLNNSAVPNWHCMPGGCLENHWSLSSLYWKDKGAGFCFSKTGQQQQQWIDDLTSKKKIQKEDKDILALSSEFLISVVHFKCATWSWRKTSSLIYCFWKYLPFIFLGFSFNLSLSQNNGVRETL